MTLNTVADTCEALEQGAVWAESFGDCYKSTAAPLRQLAADLSTGQRAFAPGLSWSPSAPWSTAVGVAERYGVDVFAGVTR